MNKIEFACDACKYASLKLGQEPCYNCTNNGGENNSFMLASENVNHPSHYTSHPSNIECIQVTRHCNFNVGNAIKYLWRAGIKDDKKHIEDLEKAIFYIKDEVKRLREVQNVSK